MLEEKFDRYCDYLKLDLNHLQEKIALLYGSARILESSILSGGFANTNYKLVVEGQPAPVVLRLPQKNIRTFPTEIAVLKRVESFIPVPSVLFADTSSEQPYAIVSWIEGIRLSEVLGIISQNEAESIGYQLGQILQKIHAVDLGRSGFFDHNFQFLREFESLGSESLAYLRMFLVNTKVRERVDIRVLDQIDFLLKQYEYELKSLSPCNRLIHSDFNPKNILVRKLDSSWQVTGILDWEFAFSGTPFNDLGNFLRFEEELPVGLAEAFLNGYISERSPLSRNWHQLSKLLDLISMFQFLSAELEYQKTFNTARTVIEKTLLWFKDHQRPLNNDHIIRKAIDSDILEIAGLLKELGYPQDDLNAFQFVFEVVARHAEMGILVAEGDGKVSGFLSYSVKPQLRLSGLSMEIDELCVAAKARGFGIGHTLLKTAISIGRELNVKRMVLSTNRQRESYERGFYLKNGFEETGSALLKMELGESMGNSAADMKKL